MDAGQDSIHHILGDYTVEEAIDYMGIGRFQYTSVMILTLGWTVDTMELMVLSVLGAELLCDWNITVFQETVLTSMSFFGVIVMSPLWGKISDKFGRVVALKLSAVLILVFGLLCSAVPNFFWMLVLRVITTSFASGCTQGLSLLPEFAPSKHRGTLIWIMNGVAATLGGVFAVALAWLVIPRWGWRVYLILCAMPSSLFFISCQWLPESPQFYIATGRPHRASQVLQHISSMNNSSLPPGSLRRIPATPQVRGEYRDLFSTKRLSIMSVTLPILWFNGIFIYYGTLLLSTSAFQGQESSSSDIPTNLMCHDECKRMDNNAYLRLLLVSFSDLPATTVGTFSIDYVGRKPLLVGGALLSSIFTCIQFGSWTSGLFSTICYFISRAAIEVTVITLLVYTPEVYPTRVRGLSVGVCNSISRLGAVVTPLVSQMLSRYNFSLTLLIYATCGLFTAVACLFLPETKGRYIAT